MNHRPAAHESRAVDLRCGLGAGTSRDKVHHVGEEEHQALVTIKYTQLHFLIAEAKSR